MFYFLMFVLFVSCHKFILINTYICVYMYIHTHTHIYIYICVCVCMYVCICPTIGFQRLGQSPLGVCHFCHAQGSTALGMVSSHDQGSFKLPQARRPLESQ